MKKSSEQLLQRRFPLITSVAMVLCFAVFPLFLVNAALDRLLQIRFDRDFAKTQHKLDQALDLIETYSNDSHYVHLLLNRSFTRATNSPVPAKQLARQIDLLKSRFPNTFFFIVWDKNGRVIDKLTDEKSYAYILRETFKLLSETAEYCRKHYPANLQKIPDIEKRLKMLRHYLGRLVPINRLKMPLQPGRLAQTVMAEPDGTKSHLWFAIGREVSMLCFINKDIFTRQTGIRFAMDYLAQKSPEIESGVCGYPVEESSILQVKNITPLNEIVVAIGKFENLHPGNILEQGNRLIAYRLLDTKRRLFCSIGINANDQVDVRKKYLIASTFKWLTVFLFILLVYTRKNSINFISVSAKLAGLFLYAGGIPVLIVVIIAADYLQQMKSELIYAQQSNKLTTLRQIDDGFVDFLKRKELDVGKILSEYYQRDNSFFKKPFLIKDLAKKFAIELKPGCTMLFDINGKNQLSEMNNSLFNDSTVISQLSNESLLFMNCPDPRRASLSEISRPLAAEMLYNMGKIINLSAGQNKTYTLYQILGDRAKYNSEAFLFLFWQFEDLQRIYLKEVCARQSDFFAYFPESDSFLNGAPARGSELAKLLQKAEKLLVTRSTSLRHKKQNYAAAAMRGANLTQATLGAVLPLSIIDAEIDKLQIRFIQFSGLFMLIAAGAVFLVRQRLIKPLSEFKTAIEAIGQRNFKLKVTVEGNNEFGKLGAALNHTMENLRELDVARLVQENLLPGKSFDQNDLKVSANLKQMSHIGGDYYDFFCANPHTTGIFIGDVSGHGISSALFMAMARSTLIFAIENPNGPSQAAIMSSLNQVIYKVRTSGAKEYMTGQSVFCNSINGEFTVISAGHCPPIIIRNQQKTWEMIPCKGIPLGFKAEPGYTAVTGKLEKGDRMILYTDGWIEAESATGIPFGFARFGTALLSCCDDNYELFAQKMFAIIESWEASRCDDLTLIITSFGVNSEQ